MKKKNIQDALYSYLMLYKKGLSVQDIIENHEVLSELCKNLQKSNRNCCDINLRFVFDEEVLFEISSSPSPSRGSSLYSSPRAKESG